MVEYFSKRSKGESFERVNRPLRHGVWVHAPNATDGDIDQLVHDYDLARNIVYDVRDHNELPRVEFSGEDAYIFLRTPRLTKTSRIATSPMLCIVKKDVFLTVGTQDMVSPELVAEAMQPATSHQMLDLLVGVVVACVAQYQELLQHTARSISDTASKLHTHEATNRDFIHFVTVEDNLVSCRMNLNGIQAVVRRIKETTHASMSERDEEALDDVRLEIEQLLVAVESYSGRVESIRNAYTTVTNNTLNLRLKTLTVFTVLITLPNVIFGMYGMNIGLPFAKASWAYLAVVAVTLAVVGVVYVVGRRTRIF